MRVFGSLHGSTLRPESQLFRIAVAKSTLLPGKLTLKALPTEGRMFALFTCIMSLLMLAFWRASITSTSSHLGCKCPMKRLSNLGIDVSLVAAVSTGGLGVPPGCVAAVAPVGWCCCWSPVDVTGPVFELSMDTGVMGLNNSELSLLVVCTCVVSEPLFATVPVVVDVSTAGGGGLGRLLSAVAVTAPTGSAPGPASISATRATGVTSAAAPAGGIADLLLILSNCSWRLTATRFSLLFSSVSMVILWLRFATGVIKTIL